VWLWHHGGSAASGWAGLCGWARRGRQVRRTVHMKLLQRLPRRRCKGPASDCGGRNRCWRPRGTHTSPYRCPEGPFGWSGWCVGRARGRPLQRNMQCSSGAMPWSLGRATPHPSVDRHHGTHNASGPQGSRKQQRRGYGIVAKYWASHCTTSKVLLTPSCTKSITLGTGCLSSSYMTVDVHSGIPQKPVVAGLHVKSMVYWNLTAICVCPHILRVELGDPLLVRCLWVAL